MRLRAAHHALPPPVLNGCFGWLARLVIVVEGAGSDVAVELGTVRCERHLEIIEYLLRQPLWVGRRLQHQRRNRADDGRLRYPAFAVASNVMHNLAATSRVADMDSILEIEMRRHRGEVIGIVIHVVAVADLAGPAVAAAVMSNDAIAVIEEEQHLRIPIIGRQRPTMTEDDGLTFAPVLIVDLYPVADCNCPHVIPSLLLLLPLSTKAPAAQMLPRGVRHDHTPS